MKYERQTPFNLTIEEVLERALEYFEHREDADHNGDRYVPNDEMILATDIRQLLFQLERKIS